MVLTSALSHQMSANSLDLLGVYLSCLVWSGLGMNGWEEELGREIMRVAL